jgi:hypothetical protein
MRTILISREILKAQIDHVVSLAYTGHLALESKCSSGLYFKDVPANEDGHVSPFVLSFMSTKRKVEDKGFRYFLAATLSKKGDSDIIKTLFNMSWEKTPKKTEVFNKAIDSILKTHVTYDGTEYIFAL